MIVLDIFLSAHYIKLILKEKHIIEIRLYLKSHQFRRGIDFNKAKKIQKNNNNNFHSRIPFSRIVKSNGFYTFFAKTKISHLFLLPKCFCQKQEQIVFFVFRKNEAYFFTINKQKIILVP